MTSLIENLKKARRVSVPLVGITTADQGALMAGLLAPLGEKCPLFKHDVLRGLQALNEQAAGILPRLLDGADAEASAIATGNPVECLLKIEALPDDSVVLMMNAHRWLCAEPGNATQTLPAVQAVWNLRDQFKENHRMLILTAPAGSLDVPPEIAGDLIMFDDPKPDGGQLAAIVKDTYEDAGIAEAVLAEESDKAVDRLRGLTAFTAEQNTAMSLTSTGLDFFTLEERWRASIMSSTPGVSFYTGDATFATIGGCANIKAYVTRLKNGNGTYSLVLFFDEIEKQFGGLGQDGGPGDSSGTTKDQLMQMLTWMDAVEASGMLFVGPPGAAKSQLAKALGVELDATMLVGDLGATKDSLVGASEARIRNMLGTVSAMAPNGGVLVVATCNSLAVLPPELKRRFKAGTFYFDLPTREEADEIWPLYEARYKVGGDRPDYTDWTGAEIKQCCETAWRLDTTLVEAATFVVPVAKSAKATIDALRQQANGCFISASAPGYYTPPVRGAKAKTGRKIDLTGATPGSGGAAMDPTKPMD